MQQQQQHQSLIQKSPQAASIIQKVCGHAVCGYCKEPLTLEQAGVLPGRAIVVTVEYSPYPDRPPHYTLFYCPFCTYHHVRVIPPMHRAHWSQEGQWNLLGAPLTADTAAAFCRQLGDQDNTRLCVVVL